MKNFIFIFFLSLSTRSYSCSDYASIIPPSWLSESAEVLFCDNTDFGHRSSIDPPKFQPILFDPYIKIDFPRPWNTKNIIVCSAYTIHWAGKLLKKCRRFFKS